MASPTQEKPTALHYKAKSVVLHGKINVFFELCSYFTLKMSKLVKLNYIALLEEKCTVYYINLVHKKTAKQEKALRML